MYVPQFAHFAPDPCTNGIRRPLYLINQIVMALDDGQSRLLLHPNKQQRYETAALMWLSNKDTIMLFSLSLQFFFVLRLTLTET